MRAGRPVTGCAPSGSEASEETDGTDMTTRQSKSQKKASLYGRGFSSFKNQIDGLNSK
jgi:hypothetical protein